MGKNILLFTMLFVAFSGVSAEQIESTAELIIEKGAPALNNEAQQQPNLSEEIDTAAMLAEQEAFKAKQQRLQLLVDFCAPCHGKSGISNIDIYPNLAGQQNDYLIKQLRDFKSKARKDNVMNGMVSRLTDEDIQDLAKYYADILIEAQQPTEEIINEKINSSDL